MTDIEIRLLRDRDWLIEKLREIVDQKRIAPARKIAFDALAGHGYDEWAKTWRSPSGQQAAHWPRCRVPGKEIANSWNPCPDCGATVGEKCRKARDE